ncbi:hypothetical protein DH2020_039440 [Rehmannia glutinosa]|uniref:Acid phosphatase n=1 Tax=Rehmannia glutinosa TaxID=99300 RepID=A0ABR0UX06_REHGL
MALIRWGIVSLLLILAIEPASSSRSFILMPTEKQSLGKGEVEMYCESWKLTVETNNAGNWGQVPEKCLKYVIKYMSGKQYLSDSEAVTENALAFLKKLPSTGMGKDAWVFDIDETLLGNVLYFVTHVNGSQEIDEDFMNDFIELAIAPPLPASLRLYKVVQALGFKIFLLTGRSEFQRNATETNLRNAGYSNWERLILRGEADQGKSATVYKSEKRKEIEDEGYIIKGNSGDQWSDLLGYAVAQRSFKLPNPMYYVH